MPFTQNFYSSIGSVTNVETVGGNLTIGGHTVLTSESDGKALAAELAKAKVAVSGLADIKPSAKEEVLREIDAASQKATSDKPEGHAIATHLDSAAEVLTSATNATAKVLGLGKALAAFGSWAAMLLT
jgi:hypothetical protein